MPQVQLVAIFPNPAAVPPAQSALLEAGLATPATMRVEAPNVNAARVRTESPYGLWDQVKRLFVDDLDEIAEVISAAAARGDTLLLVRVQEPDDGPATDILVRGGAADVLGRVERPTPPGWIGVDPIVEPQPSPDPEPAPAGICVPGRPDGDDPAGSAAPQAPAVLLADERTGRLIGRISEAEFEVLERGLEEDPQDHDFWLNPETVDMLACRPGATVHLIALLRAAVGDNSEGIDVTFQHESEPAPTSAPANADPSTPLAS